MKKEKLEEQVVIEGIEPSNFSCEKNEENEVVQPEQHDMFETETGVQLSMTDEIDLGLSKDLIETKLKEAFEYEAPKKKKKSTIVSLVLLIINLVFMGFIVKGLIDNIGDVDFGEVLVMQGSQLWWLLGGVLMYGVYMFTQTLMYKTLIRNITGKNRWKLAYDVAVVGKYYDNVTPFAVGGQPMQIVRLAKNGISAGVSTSIPIIKLMINTLVSVAITAVFLLFGLPNLPVMSGLNGFLLTLFEILGVIGFVITLIASLFMVILSSGNIVTRSFISWAIRVGYKLHLVKNYRETLKKTINQVAEYKSSMKYLRKHPKLLFKMILLSILESLSYATMIYFVVMAFSANIDTSLSFFLFCIVKYYICAMASSFIPLPGGTGMMEISFIFLFMELENTIVFALLAWRFLIYYLILIHGFVHELIGISKNLYKNRKKKREIV